MESRLSQSLAQRRCIMLLIAAFAMLAMILAGMGVYGVFSYWVSQRRQELAIRLALGSSRSELLRLIVMQAMSLILAGSVVGIAGAWFLDRLLATMLVGIQAHDPVSLSLAGAADDAHCAAGMQLTSPECCSDRPRFRAPFRMTLAAQLLSSTCKVPVHWPLSSNAASRDLIGNDLEKRP